MTDIIVKLSSVHEYLYIVIAKPNHGQESSDKILTYISAKLCFNGFEKLMTYIIAQLRVIRNISTKSLSDIIEILVLVQNNPTKTWNTSVQSSVLMGFANPMTDIIVKLRFSQKYIYKVFYRDQ